MLTLLPFLACTGPDDASRREDRGSVDSGWNETGNVDSGRDDTGDSTGPDSGSSDADGDGSSAPEDCDDADATIHPGAAEIPYDGVDQDCDGADADDLDGDGYDHTVDCDDTDPAANPAGSESPRSGADEDCDGYVDLDAASLADESVEWEGTEGYDAQRYRLGGFAPGLVAGDLDGDGLPDLVAGAGDALVLLAGGSLWSSGAALAVETDAFAAVPWSAPDHADEGGWLGVAAPGDVDGDGLPDLATISVADDYRVGCTWYGAVQPGRALAAGGTVAAWPAFFSIRMGPSATGCSGGASVVTGADLDGDGLGDALFGAAGDDPPYGQVAVVLGDTLAAGGDVGFADADTRVTSADGATGSFLAIAGDLTGDGLDDVLIGDWRLRVVDGARLAAGDALDLADDALTTYTDVSVPTAALAVGDLDDDGHDDLLLGTPGSVAGYADPLGVWLDPGGGGTFAPGDAAAFLIGGPSGEVFAASGPGSLRGRGADIVVAHQLGATTEDGHIALLRLDDIPLSGTLDLSTWGNAIAEPSVLLGRSGVLLADLDLDGDDDLVVTDASAHPRHAASGDEDHPAGVMSLFGNPR